MIHNRPLTIHVGYKDIALEQECPVCGGTGKWHPDLINLPCDSCTGGYIPSSEGVTILQFISPHFDKIMPNVAVLNKLTEHFSVRPK